MSVRYKFKSEKSFSQILFDGMYISVEDIKKEIYRQRRLGRSENVDLLISRADNNEKYSKDDDLVPKNTSIIVLRVPSSNNSVITKKDYKTTQVPTQPGPKPSLPMNISTMKATEEEKIFAMMMQSTADYQSYLQHQDEPKNKLVSSPPSTYLCRKCHVPGHWIRSCPFSVQQSNRHDPRKPRSESKRMTGIPKSMRNKLESRHFYDQNVPNVALPQNIFCQICQDIFRNPVTMPCCQAVFCYECAVVKLLETDDSSCPKCNSNFIQPNMLEDDLVMMKTVEKSLSLSNREFLAYGTTF